MISLERCPKFKRLRERLNGKAKTEPELMGDVVAYRSETLRESRMREICPSGSGSGEGKRGVAQSMALHRAPSRLHHETFFELQFHVNNSLCPGADDVGFGPRF